jgi:hypothetical protein
MRSFPFIDLAVLYGRVSIMPVIRRLLLQQDTSQTKQSVRDTAQRATMRVTTLPEGGVTGFALRIVLGSDPCPMIDGPAQSNVSSVAHNDNA